LLCLRHSQQQQQQQQQQQWQQRCPKQHMHSNTAASQVQHNTFLVGSTRLSVMCACAARQQQHMRLRLMRFLSTSECCSP
jgi:hypothetical protein